MNHPHNSSRKTTHLLHPTLHNLPIFLCIQHILLPQIPFQYSQKIQSVLLWPQPESSFQQHSPALSLCPFFMPSFMPFSMPFSMPLSSITSDQLHIVCILPSNSVVIIIPYSSVSICFFSSTLASESSFSSIEISVFWECFIVFPPLTLIMIP